MKREYKYGDIRASYISMWLGEHRLFHETRLREEADLFFPKEVKNKDPFIPWGRRYGVLMLIPKCYCLKNVIRRDGTVVKNEIR